MNERSGPLVGLEVVELGGIGPGPVCGRLLTEMGANVVRVVRPGQARDVAWPVTMRGREEIVLDLKSQDGLLAFTDLVATADVLIDPFRPDVTERLGIGPDTMLTRQPDLIYARVTGWGQDGPWASMAGHDINYLSVTGVLDAIGRADGPPQIPLNLVGDFGGGTMFLLSGILAALYERHASGLGQVVDVAIVDGVIALSGYIHGMRALGTWRDARGTNRLDSGVPYYDVYETRDGGWMAVGAVEPQFWGELVALLELEDLPPQLSEQSWPELRRRLADRFRQQSRAHWSDLFAGTDACVTPVLSWSEAVGHPHLASRGALVEESGETQPAPAPRFSRTPSQMPVDRRGDRRTNEKGSACVRR